MQNQSNGVILVVIDGVRPDSLSEARTPAIDGLMARGASTLRARTVIPSITLPVHFSIFTGVSPYNHNVTTNTGRPAPDPLAWSVSDMARSAGKTVQAFYNWEHLRSLSSPGTLSHALFMDNGGEESGDLEIAVAAAAIIGTTAPDFAFVYLGHTDVVGHDHGFGSEEYRGAIETADRSVDLLLDGLKRSDLLNRYNFILQSDHGGDGFHHKDPTDAVMTVPWIAAGPDVREGVTIEQPVNVLDTTPTIARLLGLPPHHVWEGRAVAEALREQK